VAPNLRSLVGRYINWRIEHAAIAQLCAMREQKLKDICIGRSEIESVLHGEVGMFSKAAHMRAFEVVDPKDRYANPGRACNDDLA
jgi:uncharacterized protein YjiS (DUF1127 family)